MKVLFSRKRSDFNMTAYNQAMLNEYQKMNDIECYNVTKYNKASGYGCCFNLCRANRYVLAYGILFFVGCCTGAGANGVCSSSFGGMVVLWILSAIFMWLGCVALYLEGKYLLAPLSGAPIQQKSYEGSEVTQTGPNTLTQEHKISHYFTGLDPYRDAKRFGIFCIIWTIGSIAVPVSNSKNGCFG